MLDFFRNHKRTMMFLLVLVIVPGMGFVGIEGFRGFFDESANVASVNGHKISRQDYDDAMREQLQRAAQTLGASFDAKALDTPAMRQALLDSMVQQRIIIDETQRQHLSASDNAVRSAILEIPAIAQLRKPDGSIDLAKYKQLLGMQGMTPEQFDERVRYDLASRQIEDSIQTSAFTPKAVASDLTSLIGQERDLQSLVFKPADYAAKAKPTDAELKQYYDAHQKEFEIPETAQIQYLTLSAAALAASSTPSDADLKKYYQDNIAQFRTAEEIRASHILIASPASASAADRAKAKQKAEALLAQVKAHPDQFAELAKQDSQDPGSASKGGDLGYFGPGMMVKPFEDAAFKLKKGEISGVVQSDFGYHIIEVTDIKPAVTKSFDEVKDQVTAAVKSQQAEKLFADDADAFTDTVYEKADSLQPAADKFKLQIQTATVSRKPNPAAAQTDPLNNPKFLASVFTDDALKNKHNTAAVDLGNNMLISAHVTAYQPATIQPFDAVKQTVQQKVVAQQADALAKKDGEARLAALQKSKATDGFSPTLKVSRNDAQGLPPDAVAEVFKADSSKLPAYVGVDLSDGGYVIYRVNAVHAPAAASPQQLEATAQQLSQVSAQADLDAYLAALRARSKVKFYGTPPAESTD